MKETIMTHQLPLTLLSNGSKSSIDLEVYLYEALTELLLNSEGYQALQGLSGPRVSDISIIPLGLGRIVNDFNLLLSALTLVKSIELTVEIMKSGRVCFGVNITTQEDNTFSISTVTDEVLTVQVEYNFCLCKT